MLLMLLLLLLLLLLEASRQTQWHPKTKLLLRPLRCQPRAPQDSTPTVTSASG